MKKIAFLVTFIATVGSLIFSDVLGFPPCVLCWYQRICMYPMVLIYALAIWFDDETCWRYTLILTLFGLSIAVYHNLLYYHLIPQSITPCQQGVSCTSKQVEYLGFITIPLLSLTSFILLTLTHVFYYRGRHEKK